VPAPESVRQAPTSGQDGDLRLDGESNVKPGEFVAVDVGPATPNGFLGRVTAVRQEDGSTVIGTTPAALTEVLREGRIDQTITTGPETTDDIVTRRSAGVAAPGCGGSSGFTLPEPKVKLERKIRFQADWSLFRGLQDASLTGDVTATASVMAEAAGSVKCSVPSTTLAEFKGKPITFMVGPVPVVLTPNAKVTLDASATASSSFRTGASLSATASAGVRWTKDGGFSPISEFDPDFSYTPPTMTTSAGLKADVTPTIEVLLHGVAGPELGFKTGLALDADMNGDPWWKLTAPVDLTAQLNVPALDLSSPKLHVFKKTYTLAEADGPFGTPDPSSTALGGGVLEQESSTTGSSEQWGHIEGFAPGSQAWILGTGRIADASVPDSAFHASTALEEPGDARLSDLVGGLSTYDAASYRTVVVPKGERLHVRYLFASEEYPEYVGQGYDDVMAVFIDGVNCANVPGGTERVSVDSINAWTNSAFYIDNADGAAGYSTSMDGVTVPLECIVPVTPGKAVEVVIAVADTGDGIFDSAVGILDGGIWSD